MKLFPEKNEKASHSHLNSETYKKIQTENQPKKDNKTCITNKTR